MLSLTRASKSPWPHRSGRRIAGPVPCPATAVGRSLRRSGQAARGAATGYPNGRPRPGQRPARGSAAGRSSWPVRRPRQNTRWHQQAVILRGKKDTSCQPPFDPLTDVWARASSRLVKLGMMRSTPVIAKMRRTGSGGHDQQQLAALGLGPLVRAPAGYGSRRNRRTGSWSCRATSVPWPSAAASSRADRRSGAFVMSISSVPLRPARR